MKRRIKSEIANKKNKPINPYNTVSSGQIDETLVKIADL